MKSQPCWRTNVVLVALIAIGNGVADAQTGVTADAIVESTAGGLKFPDGTIQTSAVSMSTAAVEDTGQQVCWDGAGTPISCTGTGQDGELQVGVDWPAPRFTANGDGTVRDNLTGLLWLQNANCFGPKLWVTALTDATGLASGNCGLTDGSVAGDWRMSNIKEFLSLLDFGEETRPLPSAHPFSNVVGSYMTSSTLYTDKAKYWAVEMGDGVLLDGLKTQNNFFWPVRGSSTVQLPLVVAAAAEIAISVEGIVESTSGGFRFPDGTIQTSAAAANSAPIEDTGQQDCWDEAGQSISCAGTGQDGELQAGVDWPAPRFTAVGDGTVLDNLTTLVWLEDSDCFAASSWSVALSNAAGLSSGSCGLADNSIAGDWRLPNIQELSSLVDFGQSSPPLPAAHPFLGVGAKDFYSSTTSARVPTHAWNLVITDGTGRRNISNKGGGLSTWPVRGPVTASDF